MFTRFYAVDSFAFKTNTSFIFKRKQMIKILEIPHKNSLIQWIFFAENKFPNAWLRKSFLAPAGSHIISTLQPFVFPKKNLFFLCQIPLCLFSFFFFILFRLQSLIRLMEILMSKIKSWVSLRQVLPPAKLVRITNKKWYDDVLEFHFFFKSSFWNFKFL